MTTRTTMTKTKPTSKTLPAADTAAAPVAKPVKAGPPDIQLSMTVAEAELVFNAVAQLPYVRVAPLINKLQAQAAASLASKPEDQANA